MRTIQLCKVGHALRTVLTMLCLTALFPVLAQAQNRASGTVIDEMGEPMIGVAVVELGTTNGTVTDLDGNFDLAVKSGATLQFSFVGYTTKNVKAATGMKVTLEEDNKLLEETVVIGYGVQKKSSLTGAVSSVKSEDMEARTITDASQALQGKTAGVQLSGSSSPGGQPTVRIRGIGSNGSSDPLYVIDGRIARSIRGIDPNDIESMEVLKDGASAAIYGASAGNGVILITTKKGKGNGQIKYDMQISSQSIAKVPELMDSQEFINYYVKESNVIAQSVIDQNWDSKTSTNWIDELFERSLMQRHNLTFSAGSDKGSIYVSTSYLNNNGTVKGDSDTFRRLTGMINATWKIKPWLELNTNNQISHMKIQSVGEGSEYGSTFLTALQFDPMTKPYYTVNDMPASMRRAYDAWQAGTGPRLYGPGDGTFYGISPYVTLEGANPLISRASSFTKNRMFNINGTTLLNFSAIPHVVITSRLSYQMSNNESYGVTRDYYGSEKSSQNFVNLSAGDNNTVYYQWENFANWNQTFNRVHNLGLMIGSSYSENRTFGVSGGTNGSKEDYGVLQDLPTFWYIAYATPTATKSISGGEANYIRKLAYFGRASYDYQGKYLVQYNFRADAADSSILPIDNRWGYFNGVSLGYTLTQEKFMESTRGWLDFLKLRASWGQNGSIASLGNYMYAKNIASSANYPTHPADADFGYITTYAPSSAGNPNLKWETSEQTNVGVDARFLKNRLSFTMDWFRKNTKDLIVTGAALSYITGLTESPINAGDIRNEGFEFELGWQDQIGKDFHYGIRANLSTLKNEVTYIHPSLTSGMDGATFHVNGAVTRFEVDHPAWYFYGYKFKGINSETGNPEFYDVNGDGQIGPEDKTEIGKGMASMNFGITLNAAWKGIDFIMFGSGAVGNDIYCLINRADYPTNRLTEFTNDRWTESNRNGSKPRAGATDYDKYLMSDAVVYDGSYFKIKQIQLGYSLPKAWLSKVFISNMRIYGSLEDYFTFTKYPGFDPETTGTGSSMGLDKGVFPTSKKLVFGASITF